MSKNKIHKMTAVLFALLFWQIAAMILNRSFLLSSPVDVIKASVELGISLVFWQGMGKSIIKIILGFLSGAGIGILFAGLSYRFKIFEIYIAPYIMVIRSVPVASFVIIILIFYANMLEGLKSVDIKMLEMAKIFEIGKKAKLIYIYLPALESFLISAALASIGIAFKSGIAAEVIGRPKNTLGFFLFDAKVYLETAKVFAITLIVILCSAVFERLTVFIFKRFFDLIKRFY